MGGLKATWLLCSVAAVAFLAGIPHVSCGPPPPKTGIKLIKPTSKSSHDLSRRHQQTQHGASVEDEVGYSGGRPNFDSFPQGFTQGGPTPYRFTDEPSDRYDIEESPGNTEQSGMGFMPEFGPPKGFPDLSKLTGGEFPKMDAPASGGNGGLENVPQYSTYQNTEKPYRPFLSYSPPSQGAPNYDDSDDGPHGNDGGFGGVSLSSAPPQNAPRRKPFRGARPPFGGGRPGGFGGPGGPGPYGEGSDGPSAFGAPEGLGGGPGPYGGGPQGLDGPRRPFGARPSFSGPSPDGPSSYRPAVFGGPDGPSSRPGPFGSDGPSSRSPFGSTSDGPPPSRPGGFFGGSSDGPSRPPPHFGSGGEGPPSSRPGYFGGLDGPTSSSPFDGSNDGPPAPSGPSAFSPYDGPSRPSSFSGGPPSRPGPFSGRPSRPFGGPPRHSPFGSPAASNIGSDGPGPYDGPPSSPPPPQSSGFSFQNSAPGSPPGGFRLSRGYPRYHPNQIQNDDYKESNDDYPPQSFHGPPPSQYNYPPPPRQYADYSRNEEYARGPYPADGPRTRRPEFLPQSPLGSLFGSTHRQDGPKRPFVLKKNLKTKEKETEPAEESRTKSYLVKSRPKRDIENNATTAAVSTTTTAATSTTTTTTTSPATPTEKSTQPCKSRRCNITSVTVSKKHNDRRRKTKPNPPMIRRIFNATTTTARPSASNDSSVTRSGRALLAKSSEDPMQADGTQQAEYWDVASPYDVYSSYKKPSSSSAGVNAHVAHHHPPTASDRHDEYEDEVEDEHVAPLLTSSSRNTRRNHTYHHDTTSDEQRFFPSFPAPPSPYLNPFASSGSFGRPPLFPGPTANRAPSRFHPQFGPKYTAPPPNRGPSSAYPAESHERYLHTNLLGSGNFEVVRGGTYYGDDDDGYHHTNGGGAGHYHHDDDDGYFHHNGHSSPHGYRNNPSAGGGDFFANFRDFADINPPTRSFSHHHETVADSEPHGSASHEVQPKNILDKLESSSDKIEVHQPFTSSSSSIDNDPMMATF